MVDDVIAGIHERRCDDQAAKFQLRGRFPMARKLSRRAFTAGAAAATASFNFAPAIAQAAPFKIGLLTVKTGPLAQGGIQMEQGIAALLKEKGNTFAG